MKAAAALLSLFLACSLQAEAADSAKSSRKTTSAAGKPAAAAKTAAAKTPVRTPAAKTAAKPQSVKKNSPAKTASGKTANRKSSAAADDSSANRSQKKGLESQQKAIQQQIGALQKDISRNQAKRNEEAAAAKQAGAALSASNQKLEKLDADKKRTQNTLATIRKQSGEVAGSLAETRRDIRETARFRYLYANQHPMTSLISGESPSEAGQNAAMLAYLAGSHQKKAEKLENTQTRLQSAEKKTTALAASIAADTRSEKQSNSRIAAEQEKHEANTQALGREIASQQKQVEELKKDQQRLSALITQINAVIAAQEKARKERLAREAAERKRLAALEKARKEQAARDRKAGKKPRQSETAAAPQKPLPEEPRVSSAGLGRLQGRLALPVSGIVAGRYGQSRNGVGTWQGLFIRAPEGSAVHAIAEGRVVYSGNLRGFGNLLILDHGESYLSVYAYNSALLKSNGASVKQGETIARSGSGASGDTPGLYFEIRYQGKTVNPSRWVR